MPVVAESDIDREARVRGSGRQLERAVAAVRSGQPKHQLLRAEMAGVAGLRVVWARQAQRQWTPHRDPIRDPESERRAGAFAELNLADSRLVNAETERERLLCQATSLARRAKLEAEPDRDRLGFAISIHATSGPPPPRRLRSVTSPRTNHSLTFWASLRLSLGFAAVPAESAAGVGRNMNPILEEHAIGHACTPMSLVIA